MADAIDDEVRAGRTVISSNHEFAEARRADQVLLLARRLVSAGPPASALRDACLREAYGGRVVATEAGHVLLDDPHHAH